TVHLYLGIPYAESPTGQNRYKAPITRTKWDGILDASYYKVYLHGSNFNYASSSVIPVEDIARKWATNDIIVVRVVLSTVNSHNGCDHAISNLKAMRD
uniref:Carboxylesterase type B domain-containing protein n=1 Tax=Parascaris univalens TaxID=6257 RepID=A0A915BB36_PARUN